MISMEAATKAVGPRTAHHRLITGATCDGHKSKPSGSSCEVGRGAREMMRSKANEGLPPVPNGVPHPYQCTSTSSVCKKS